jgi:hypothetical protein
MKLSTATLLSFSVHPSNRWGIMRMKDMKKIIQYIRPNGHIFTTQVAKPEPKRVEFVRDDWELFKIADMLEHTTPERVPYDYMKINPVWKFHKVTMNTKTYELSVIYDLLYVERMSNFRVVWSHLFTKKIGGKLNFVKAHPPRYYPARR